MQRSHSCSSVIAFVVFIAVPIGCAQSAPRETTERAKQPPAAAAQDTPKAAAGVDGCSLLTKEEVGAAIGKPVTPLNRTTGEAASCEYHNAARQPDKFLDLVVYTMT